MLKILFLLECDSCDNLMPHVLSSSNLDPEEWEGWANELPLIARRMLNWRTEDNFHTCPECLWAAGELDEDIENAWRLT